MKKIVLFTLCLFIISCARKGQNIVLFNEDLDTVLSISDIHKMPVCVILFDSTKTDIFDFLSNLEMRKIPSVPVIINVVNICIPENEWYVKILDPDIYPLTCVFEKGVLLDLIPGASIESYRYIDNVIAEKTMSEFHYNQKYNENKRLFISFANSAIKNKMLFDEKKLISKDIDSLMSYYEHPYMYYLKMINASSFGHTEEAKDAANKLVAFGLSDNVAKYYDEILSANQFLDSTYIYGSAPLIETTQRVVSISECHVNNTYHLSLPIINRGKKDLVISEIMASCSCVRINSPDSIIIKGGDYKTIEVDFTPDVTGTLKREIYIVSNSIETPVFIITINAQVE